ncbi:ribbon-helix-helix protein, CopG family [bacterium]|nr:ribbon-helix-helix protein, CopG family [bacterium]
MISLKVPEWLLNKVDEIAEREGISRSEVIRNALIEYINGGRKTYRQKRFMVKYVVLS